MSAGPVPGGGTAMSANTSVASPVVILGMHRSGTSCLAGCLQEAGLFMGEVVTSAPHNRKGNRENRRIVQLHNAVLADNGGSWREPPRTFHWSRERIAEHEAIVRTMPMDRLWGFKDPRTLVLLDRWLDRCPSASLVGTYRHPYAVARSLERRSKLPEDEALDLWVAYNTRLVAAWERSPFPVVDFDLALEDYLETVSALAERLGLRTPGGGFRFPESNLKHHAPPPDSLPTGVVATTYQRLLEIGRSRF